MKYELERNKSKPGDAVIRFGNWRERKPTVIIDSRHWVSLGKPESLTVIIPEKE